MSVFLVLLISAIVIYIFSQKNKTSPLPSRVAYCRECGTVTPPKRFLPGSDGVEVALWLLFLLPGVIYSVWRRTSHYWGCGNCKSARIIDPDSPIAPPPDPTQQDDTNAPD